MGDGKIQSAFHLGLRLLFFLLITLLAFTLCPVQKVVILLDQIVLINGLVKYNDKGEYLGHNSCFKDAHGSPVTMSKLKKTTQTRRLS